MSLAWFPVALLGVWRITHLLAVEDGPGDVIVQLRTITRSRSWGNLLDCFQCVSLWVAVPFAIALGSEWLEQLMLWPALSGAAILLDRIIERVSPSPAAFYVEHATPMVEGDHDMLPR